VGSGPDFALEHAPAGIRPGVFDPRRGARAQAAGLRASDDIGRVVDSHRLLLKSLVNLMHVDLACKRSTSSGSESRRSERLYQGAKPGAVRAGGKRAGRHSGDTRRRGVAAAAGCRQQLEDGCDGRELADPHADNTASIDEVGPGFFGTLEFR